VNGAHPEILSRYFSAVERCDLESLNTCFSDDATLRDDNRTYHGRAEIVAWRRAAGPAYEFVVEVLDWKQTADGTYIVNTNVASTGSGEPVPLEFRFTLDGPLITDLRIAG
jgi:hypothetical protein